MKNEIVIDVKKISKVFDLSYLSDKKRKTYRALNNVSFKLYKGEKLGIIGRNGSGKSTLLKILSNVMLPSSGSALIRGTLCSILEIGTGFKAQLTGRENIYLYGSILGYSEARINGIINSIIAFSELRDFIDLPLKTYSSGMQSKLAFSTTIFLEPEILILDEVLAVGDLGFKQKCIARMNELASENQTIIFVSHSHGALRKFCDRLLWLENGKIIKSGQTEVVLKAYENSFNKEKKIHDTKTSKPKNKSNKYLKIKKFDTNLNKKNQSKTTIKFKSNINISADILIKSGKNIKNISSNLIIIKKTTSSRDIILTSLPNQNFIKKTNGKEISISIDYSVLSLNLLPGNYFMQFGLRGLIDDVIQKSFIRKNFVITNSDSINDMQRGHFLVDYSVKNRINEK